MPRRFFEQLLQTQRSSELYESHFIATKLDGLVISISLIVIKDIEKVIYLRNIYS